MAAARLRAFKSSLSDFDNILDFTLLFESPPKDLVEESRIAELVAGRSWMKGIWLSCMVLPEGIFSNNWAEEDEVELLMPPLVEGTIGLNLLVLLEATVVAKSGTVITLAVGGADWKSGRIRGVLSISSLGSFVCSVVADASLLTFLLEVRAFLKCSSNGLLLEDAE